MESSLQPHRYQPPILWRSFEGWYLMSWSNQVFSTWFRTWLCAGMSLCLFHGCLAAHLKIPSEQICNWNGCLFPKGGDLSLTCCLPLWMHVSNVNLCYHLVQLFTMVPMLSTVSVFFVVYDTPHVLQPSQCAESEPLLNESFRAQL